MTCCRGHGSNLSCLILCNCCSIYLEVLIQITKNLLEFFIFASIILKLIVKIVCKGMVQIQLAQDNSMAHVCEHGDEPSSYVKAELTN